MEEFAALLPRRGFDSAREIAPRLAVPIDAFRKRCRVTDQQPFVMRRLIEQLNLDSSGGFFKRDGSRHEW